MSNSPNHILHGASYHSYDSKDCKSARKSLRYYKNKAHKKVRQLNKKEIISELND